MENGEIQELRRQYAGIGLSSRFLQTLCLMDKCGNGGKGFTEADASLFRDLYPLPAFSSCHFSITKPSGGEDAGREPAALASGQVLPLSPRMWRGLGPRSGKFLR
jgi:hypothetical protein